LTAVRRAINDFGLKKNKKQKSYANVMARPHEVLLPSR
jgi:hypothetical protein